MKELPSNVNLNLPIHPAVFADGKPTDTTCPGKQVRDIVSDVGIFEGGCNRCCEEFVYMVKTDSWVTQKDFDLMIRNGVDRLGNVIRSL